MLLFCGVTVKCPSGRFLSSVVDSKTRCDIKGSDGTMLNPIFWKKVQGQKHPGRWGIVEHQIPSIKVLFKTNAKSHKYPGIKLSSSESKTQLVNQKYKHRASGREQWSSGGNTSSNPQVSAPVPRPVVNGMERMCQTPTLLFESKNDVSINSYSKTYVWILI